MGKQTWQETVEAALVDGAALTNTLTATSILIAASKPIIPATTLEIGGRYRLTAQGRISTVVTTPGTLTLDTRFGSVIVANGGAMALNIVAKVNVPWALEWDFTVRSIGNGTLATLMHQGTWASEAVIASPLPTVGGAGTLMLPNAAPAVGTGFDSTVAITVDLFATWSVANAANSIQVHQFMLESLN